MFLDKEKSDCSGHIWNEVEELVCKCFLIKRGRPYDMGTLNPEEARESNKDLLLFI